MSQYFYSENKLLFSKGGGNFSLRKTIKELWEKMGGELGVK